MSDSKAAADREVDGLDLLVAIPALNEEPTVCDVIRRVPREIPGIRSVDVLVIDDGSTDDTAARSRSAGAVVIVHPVNRGLGATFQTALRYSLDERYDLLVSIDGDGQFDPAHIPRLIEPVVSGQADFATASRFADPALVPDMPRVKLWGNKMMSRLISRIAGQRFYDVSCGMRCYSRIATRRLNLMGQFTYVQEVFLNLAFKGLRIVEVPIPVQGVRRHGRSRVARNLFRYAWNTSKIIFRCYRDHKPMSFFGRIALVLFLPGAALEIFLFVHYLLTGSLSPHKWAGFVGGGLIFLAALTLLFGMIADMLDRHRMYLEELIFHIRSGAGSDRDTDK